MEKLVIAGREFNSRLFLGTGKFNSNEVMEHSGIGYGNGNRSHEAHRHGR